MHMISLSMPIPASTELTEFLYILCRIKITALPLEFPSAGARGHMPPLHQTQNYVEHIVTTATFASAVTQLKCV